MFTLKNLARKGLNEFYLILSRPILHVTDLHKFNAVTLQWIEPSFR